MFFSSSSSLTDILCYPSFVLSSFLLLNAARQTDTWWAFCSFLDSKHLQGKEEEKEEKKWHEANRDKNGSEVKSERQKVNISISISISINNSNCKWRRGEKWKMKSTDLNCRSDDLQKRACTVDFSSTQSASRCAKKTALFYCTFNLNCKKLNLVRKSKNFLLGRMYLFGCLLLIFELIIFFAFSFQNDWYPLGWLAVMEASRSWRLTAANLPATYSVHHTLTTTFTTGNWH